MPKKYNNDSISSLKGPDRVRKRPGVIFGSDDIEGCAHSFFEILSNSTDEAKAGFGNRIEVTRFKDNSIQVRDFGRGVPLDYNKKEERFNWELVYCELFAGGKYNSELYDSSLGLNGLGACATQYASEYFDVTSIRDGYEYSMHFEHGNPIGELKKKKAKSKETGTTQKWKPDIDVFTDIDIPLEKFQSVLKEQAVVNTGVTFILDDEESGIHEEYYYPEGILGYIKELTADTENVTEPYLFKGEGRGRDREDKPEYAVRAFIAFCFNNKIQKIRYFHNSSNLEHGGSPEKAIKTAFVCSFDRYAKEQKKYTKNESKITFNDIADCLVIISNTFSELTSYENQTKKAINNKYIQEFLTNLIKEHLSIWMIEHKEEADKVLDQILINKRSRESSESQRIQVKKKLMQKTDVVNKVKKFVDCRSKDSNERELFICEGDSALGSLITARDANFQALMPIRGKILNIEKASLNQVFGSDVIMDLIRVFGCGIEVRGRKLPKDIPAFDIEKLNYSKIIIATDADVDGFHIATLITTMLYRLCPQLIEKGYLYIVETPLFEITERNGKNEKIYFAYNDAERDRIIKGKDMKKITIQRSKGLGENSSEMMSKAISKGTRKLTRVTADTVEEMQYWFDLFMGNDVPPRKRYIEENGYLYMDDLDVS